jgi:hypothetical protein
MKAIRVDFAPRSSGRIMASIRPLHWLLAAIGSAVCVGGIVAQRDLAQQQAVRQAEFEQTQTQAAARSALSSGIRKPVISETQASAVNSAIQQLNLPWALLLTAIERATPSSVALLELTPDAKKHLVRGVAEAKTTGTMLVYITRLKQQPFMGNVILTKHEVSGQDPNRPLRFEFEAKWLEAGQ